MDYKQTLFIKQVNWISRKKKKHGYEMCMKKTKHKPYQIFFILIIMIMQTSVNCSEVKLEAAKKNLNKMNIQDQIIELDQQIQIDALETKISALKIKIIEKANEIDKLKEEVQNIESEPNIFFQLSNWCCSEKSKKNDLIMTKKLLLNNLTEQEQHWKDRQRMIAANFNLVKKYDIQEYEKDIKKYKESLEKKFETYEREIKTLEIPSEVDFTKPVDDVENFFKNLGEIPVLDEIRNFCTTGKGFKREAKSNYGTIKRFKNGKIMKRMKIDNTNLKKLDIQRETILAIISRVYHPDLFLQVYGFFTVKTQTGDYACMIMEDGGKNLEELEKHIMPNKYVKAAFLKFVKNVVATLSELKITHHDIKQTNIVYSVKDTGHVFKLIDFGLASFERFDSDGKYLSTASGAKHFVHPIVLNAHLKSLEKKEKISFDCTTYDTYALGIVIMDIYVKNYKAEVKIIQKTNPFSQFQIKQSFQDLSDKLSKKVKELSKLQNTEEDKLIAKFLRENVLKEWKYFIESIPE